MNLLKKTNKIDLKNEILYLTWIRFMNLDQNQADVISDFVSIFSATVKSLKIDLT